MASFEETSSHYVTNGPVIAVTMGGDSGYGTRSYFDATLPPSVDPSRSQEAFVDPSTTKTTSLPDRFVPRLSNGSQACRP